MIHETDIQTRALGTNLQKIHTHAGFQRMLFFRMENNKKMLMKNETSYPKNQDGFKIHSSPKNTHHRITQSSKTKTLTCVNRPYRWQVDSISPA